MDKPDLDAVTTRRATVARELSQLDSKRNELLSEDEELEVAERALTRLADFFYGAPVTIPPLATPQRSHRYPRDRTSWRPQLSPLPSDLAGALKRLAVRTFLAGRTGWTTVRRIVEKRVR